MSITILLSRQSKNTSHVPREVDRLCIIIIPIKNDVVTINTYIRQHINKYYREDNIYKHTTAVGMVVTYFKILVPLI